MKILMNPAFLDNFFFTMRLSSQFLLVCHAMFVVSQVLRSSASLLCENSNLIGVTSGVA